MQDPCVQEQINYGEEEADFIEEFPSYTKVKRGDSYLGPEQEPYVVETQLAAVRSDRLSEFTGFTQSDNSSFFISDQGFRIVRNR